MQQTAAPISSQPVSSQPAVNGNKSPILEIKNLHTYFFQETGTVRAVRGVDLRLDRQSVLGIVGESGCGKSITAMSVMQLIKSPPGRIVEGEILFYRKEGQPPINIVDLDPAGSQMRQIRGGEIAVIFQEPMTSLNPLFSVGSQIKEVIKLHQDVSDAQADQRALEMLEKVQISEPKRRLKQYPHQLSGGMRQRVMIAMALSCNPAILIADEPTTALDVTVQREVLDLIAELVAERGMGLLFISHNLALMARSVRRLMVMYGGIVAESGPTASVFERLAHPYTRALFASRPRLGLARGTRLPTIPGRVPELADLPVGCPFAERCERADDACRAALPPALPVASGHVARCIHMYGAHESASEAVHA